MGSSGVPTSLTARRFYTRAIPGIWWVAGPVIGLLVVCASLGAIIAAYYADGIDQRKPTRYYSGAEADVIVPIWATRVNLWAEFPTTPAEAADLADVYGYVGLSSAFTGSLPDGSPWSVGPVSDLRSYLRQDGERLVVGVPVGASTQVGARVSMTEFVPSGWALGFNDESRLQVLPLAFVLTAIGGIVLFLVTMTPRRNPFEAAIEAERRERRAEAKRAKQELSQEREARYMASARANYRRELYEWQRRNASWLAQGELMDSSAPVDPDSVRAAGPLAVVMTMLVLAGPLWGLLVAVTTGVQTLNSQIAGDSALTALLPLMGDTPWRVFVMATTAMLVISLAPALAVVLAWRVNMPRLRTFALIATAVLLIAMLVFVVVGTTLPIDRAIR